MTPDRKRMREIAEAAKTGPWIWSNTDIFDVYIPKADALHIATFDPPTILALLDALDRAEGIVREMRLDLEEAQDDLAEAVMRKNDASRLETALNGASEAVTRARNRAVEAVGGGG